MIASAICAFVATRRLEMGFIRDRQQLRQVLARLNRRLRRLDLAQQQATPATGKLL
jgi:hypothetical protein